MKPLPADEQNPLADVTVPAGGDTLEDLILWLAYKEANALIQFDEALVNSPRLAKHDLSGGESDRSFCRFQFCFAAGDTEAAQLLAWNRQH